ncbi:MAG: cytochrome C oxidase subunit IV family protein [Parvularculaceae bacterium]
MTSDPEHETTPMYLIKPDLKTYLDGFFYAVVLTVIPFALVWLSDMKKTPGVIVITAFAVIQIGIHMRYFLHYSTERAPVSATISIALAIIAGVVFVGGALWIMGDLNARMMP